MKNLTNKILSLILLMAVFVSCNNQPSLQKYYVESEQSNNFISLDIPASVFNLKEDVSPESKETLSSLKKLNVLAFKIDEENKEAYISEKEKVKKILKNKKFNELMRGKHQNVNFIIKYLGDDDEIDEVILYASENSQGFVIARVLGDNMNPAKIMKLMKEMENLDKDNPAFSQLEGFIGEFK